MRAGLLRHKVTIQSRVESQGSTGEVTWTWEDVATVHAAVEPLTGREAIAAQQVQSEATVKVRIRYREGITTKMRVKHGSRYYGIEAVLQMYGEFKEVQLMCKEREADGWRT